MDRENLLKLVPKHKFDLANAEELINIGYPEVEPVLPEIIEWVFDGNWPVARCLQNFLEQLGKPAAPYLKRIFDGDYESAKHSILTGVVGHSKELALELRRELVRMAHSPTLGEVHEQVNEEAQDILGRLNDVSDVDWK